MPNISYVFWVNPVRQNVYTIPTNNVEVRSISAREMEVRVSDSTAGATAEAFVMQNDVRLGISVIIGSNTSLKFYNQHNSQKAGYIGGVA